MTSKTPRRQRSVDKAKARRRLKQESDDALDARRAERAARDKKTTEPNGAKRDVDCRQKKKPPFIAENVCGTTAALVLARGLKTPATVLARPQIAKPRKTAAASVRPERSGLGLLFRFDFNDELREAGLFTGSRVLVPELASGGAVKRAANATELGFGRFDIAGAKLFDKGLDTVANDGTRGAVAIATNDVLSKSLFCAFNIRHVNLCNNKKLTIVS